MNLYFDNAATSWPKPESVYQAVAECMRHLLGNPGRSSGGSGGKLVFQTRMLLGKMFNIGDSSHVLFSKNATEAINLALMGFLQAGDRVVTTSMEHNAVSRPLRALQRLKKVQVDRVKASKEGYVDPDDIRKALEKPADMVVVNHASNVCGSVMDINAIGAIVQQNGAAFMVDASQSAGVVPIDVQSAHIDILCAPGHKSLLGPTGTGFCFLAEGIEPEPLMYGGTGSLSERVCQPEVLPDRYESGTLNFHGVAGLRAGLEYVLDQGHDKIWQREREIIGRVIDGLQAIPGITLHGPGNRPDRLPVFSLTVRDTDPADLANILEDEFHIKNRVGLHCAPWAHETLGTDPFGSVRISPGIFHTDAEIDHMLECLDRASSRLLK